jgi:uncharacterized protein (TIGR02246 family)
MGREEGAEKLEVLQVEAAWVQALRTLDLEAMDHILADDYTQITASGEVIDKREFLASFEGEHRHWDRAESTDHDIRVYGNTAVMVAMWRASGVNHGERFDYKARFLAVYVKRDGRWQLTADQSTPLEVNGE